MTENEPEPGTPRWLAALKRRFAGPIRWGTAVVEFVLALKPVRVFNRYTGHHAPLLAAGMSYQALFAVFAGVYVGFTLAGLWLAANPAVWAALIDLINGFIPGLLQAPGSDEEALVDPDSLIQPLSLGISGIIALVGLVVTSIGWIGATRTAVRGIFRLPNDTTFFLLLTLRDLGMALALGLALVAAAVLSVLSTSALGLLAGALGASTSGAGFVLLSQAVATLLVFVIDTLTLVALFLVISGIQVPGGILWRGALLGGAAMTVLQLLGGSLLGGVAANPLLASFTALIGVLIWFNLMNQLLLMIAAWVATGVDDRRSEITDTVAMRSTAERRVLRATQRVLQAQQELASAMTVAAALTPEHPSTPRAGQSGDPGRSV
ncbi:YihY/virulence factor BrkB family protein [Microterricola viridarii]|uniref:Membrane protein n=1 Tax=Microterricola viridarii TaxID=412690 RepID=A0A1H1XA95_9MICO|nr:YihY/virulence factor BrkB family protein [Microterricola viridarii]SDT05616.1 membrane protein [Microterricola viridarii]